VLNRPNTQGAAKLHKGKANKAGNSYYGEYGDDESESGDGVSRSDSAPSQEYYDDEEEENQMEGEEGLPNYYGEEDVDANYSSGENDADNESCEESYKQTMP